jgi:NhaA family Na+:H+ antiporter
MLHKDFSDRIPLWRSRRKALVRVSPWEKAFDRVLTPLEEFIHHQTTSSVLLMISAVFALIIANSPWGEKFFHMLHEEMAVVIIGYRFHTSLLHWINDGLMAFFFLIIGLELKRELLVGELADWRKALLPLLAAIGGMIVPAGLYYLLNPAGVAAIGWGIPMATDIAFAVGVISLLGNRVPKSLVMFLIALAIVDDLGAVTVIALFYTDELNTTALFWCAGLTGILIAMNLGGIRRVPPYLAVGGFLWWAMLGSGIHATITGIILAFCIPIFPKYNPEHFIQQVRGLSQQMKKTFKLNPNIMLNDELRAQVVALERGVGLVQAPAQRLEHSLHVYVTYLVIPVFALANASIPIDFGDLGGQLMNTVAMGVVAGLLMGKLIGVVGFTWLAVRFGGIALPEGLTMRHIIGVGLLAGIGFTMSIFVADLGFANHPEILLQAKSGILLASLVSGVGGYCWLRFGSPPRA